MICTSVYRSPLITSHTAVNNSTTPDLLMTNLTGVTLWINMQQRMQFLCYFVVRCLFVSRTVFYCFTLYRHILLNYSDRDRRTVVCVSVPTFSAANTCKPKYTYIQLSIYEHLLLFLWNCKLTHINSDKSSLTHAEIDPWFIVHYP